MSEPNLFKPTNQGGSIGKKVQQDGKFVNPPAYPELSGFDGPSNIGPHNNFPVEKTPGARKGKV